ncbi:LysR family transcriptional regulator [Psychrobacillus glaciei]|uniref:LysR family transcriptional regulator n=1 Tax=Psychrobacillus glaciei TaxID=2283160 RepID=A0A5J6SUA7_9BACI|nr:LysR family transcriptional regulator [Psychrobacillus glaciei]
MFQYEVFIEVVESGSFTKAGEKLGLSQSGVSHNISTLETELGIILLHRNRNGTSLTNAGSRVVSHIRQIIHYGRLLEQEAALIQGIEVGCIKIGSFPSFSSKMLPFLISKFRTIYPGIQIELYEGGYDEIKGWLTSGTIDVGFLTLPFTEFETIPLFEDQLFALVPDNHPLSIHKVINVQSIHEQPFIMPKAGCEILIKNLFRKNNIQPNIIFEIKENNTIISMVQEELGITIIPEMVLPKSISNTKIIPIEPNLFREIGIAIKSMKDASPSVKKFIGIAKELLQYEKA